MDNTNEGEVTTKGFVVYLTVFVVITKVVLSFYGNKRMC